MGDARTRPDGTRRPLWERAVMVRGFSWRGQITWGCLMLALGVIEFFGVSQLIQRLIILIGFACVGGLAIVVGIKDRQREARARQSGED